jgi:hypothetical protein
MTERKDSLDESDDELIVFAEDTKTKAEPQGSLYEDHLYDELIATLESIANETEIDEDEIRRCIRSVIFVKYRIDLKCVHKDLGSARSYLLYGSVRMCKWSIMKTIKDLRSRQDRARYEKELRDKGLSRQERLKLMKSYYLIQSTSMST